MSQDVSIESTELAEAGRRVLSAFSRFKDPFSEDSKLDSNSVRSTIERIRQGFLLWSVNLGLFDRGHKSLDYRLKDTPDARELVRDLLDEFSDNLEDLSQALQVLPIQPSTSIKDSAYLRTVDLAGSSSDLNNASQKNGGDNDSDDEGELAVQIESINDIQRRLFKIAHSIRRPATRSAPGIRDVYRTIDASYRQDAKTQLFALESHRIEDYIIQEKRSLAGAKNADGLRLTSLEMLLCSRMARFNSFRRQQFIYWRQRHAESDKSTLGPDPGVHQEQLAPLIVENKPKHGNSRPDKHVELDPLQQRASMPSSVTRLKLEHADFKVTHSVASQDTRAPSAYGPSGDKADWPDASNIQAGEFGYFKCPFCHNLCPNTYLSPNAWKQHLIHDLKPYCCTYEQCNASHYMYESFSQWTAHEQLMHNQVIRCFEHTDAIDEYPTFTNIDEYSMHVQQEHDEKASEMIKAEVVNSRTEGSHLANRLCPFCSRKIEESRILTLHVAWHLETIALMALPRSTGLETDSDRGSADILSNAPAAAEQQDESSASSGSTLAFDKDDDKHSTGGDSMVLDDGVYREGLIDVITDMEQLSAAFGRSSLELSH